MSTVDITLVRWCKEIAEENGSLQPDLYIRLNAQVFDLISDDGILVVHDGNDPHFHEAHPKRDLVRR